MLVISERAFQQSCGTNIIQHQWPRCINVSKSVASKYFWQHPNHSQPKPSHVQHAARSAHQEWDFTATSEYAKKNPKKTEHPPPPP